MIRCKGSGYKSNNVTVNFFQKQYLVTQYTNTSFEPDRFQLSCCLICQGACLTKLVHHQLVRDSGGKLHLRLSESWSMHQLGSQTMLSL